MEQTHSLPECDFINKAVADIMEFTNNKEGRQVLIFPPLTRDKRNLLNIICDHLQLRYETLGEDEMPLSLVTYPDLDAWENFVPNDITISPSTAHDQPSTSNQPSTSYQLSTSNQPSTSNQQQAEEAAAAAPLEVVPSTSAAAPHNKRNQAIGIPRQEQGRPKPENQPQRFQIYLPPRARPPVQQSQWLTIQESSRPQNQQFYRPQLQYFPRPRTQQYTRPSFANRNRGSTRSHMASAGNSELRSVPPGFVRLGTPPLYARPARPIFHGPQYPFAGPRPQYSFVGPPPANSIPYIPPFGMPPPYYSTRMPPPYPVFSYNPVKPTSELPNNDDPSPPE